MVGLCVPPALSVASTATKPLTEKLQMTKKCKPPRWEREYRLDSNSGKHRSVAYWLDNRTSQYDRDILLRLPVVDSAQDAPLNLCNLMDDFLSLLFQLSWISTDEMRERQVCYESEFTPRVALRLPDWELVDTACRLISHIQDHYDSSDGLLGDADHYCYYCVGKMHSDIKEFERIVGEKQSDAFLSLVERNRGKKVIVDRTEIVRALQVAWNECKQKTLAIECAAESLGLGKSTLRNRMDEFRITDDQWKKNLPE